MKTKLTLVFIILFLSFLPSFSQQCSNDSLLLMPMDGTTYSDPGFQNSNYQPCMLSGTYSEVVIPFNNYHMGARLLTLADTSIAVANIYSVKIESISNLPSGLCWITRPANQTITGSQTGMLIIKGTTTSSVGVYPLSVNLSLDLIGSGSFTYTGLAPSAYKALLSQPTIRVMDNTYNCPAVPNF